MPIRPGRVTMPETNAPGTTQGIPPGTPAGPPPGTIVYADFERVDIRVGTIVDAQPFPQARKPSIKLTIDFGPEVGVKRSAAQLTVHYRPDQLIGRQVCAVVNFAPRQIGPFMSEVLTLGMPDEEGAGVAADG